MNHRLFEKKLLKSILIILVALSKPIYIFNQDLFFIISSLFTYILAISLNYFFKKTYREFLNAIFFFPWLRVLLLLIGTLFMLIGFNDEVNGSKVVAIFFIWSIPIICIWGIIEIAYQLFNIQKKLDKKESKINKIIRVVLILLILGITTILPELAFGYGYRVFFDIIFGISLPSQIDGFYLSFSITHTLPVTDATLSGYMSKINSDNNLRLYQSVQVYFNRFMELIIIAVLVKTLFEVIDDKNQTNR